MLESIKIYPKLNGGIKEGLLENMTAAFCLEKCISYTRQSTREEGHM